MRHTPLLLLVAVLLPAPALAQSSSLYVTQDVGPARERRAATEPADDRANRLSSAIAGASFSAVVPPEPRQFAVHDLITIVIREQSSSDIESNLETDKSLNLEGEITELPKFDLTQLLNAQLRPNVFPEGTPKVGVDFENNYEGEGEYGRTDTVTGRITARVIDVKPNGTMVLEARKQIRNDDETLTMTLTGDCRVEDVTLDNTILSSELYDLHLNKQHEGEIRNASKKGFLTRVFDGIFSF